MAEVELELPHVGATHQLQGEAHDLHVRGRALGAEQLRAHLEDLARPAALPGGVLAKHLACVAQAQGRRPVGELGRRETGHARGEVVSQRQQLAVQVEEADQAVGDLVPAGTHEHFGVLESRWDDLLVAAALDALQHAALQQAAAPHGVSREVEGARRDGSDAQAPRHAGTERCTSRAAPTRRPSIATISKTAPRTVTRSPTRGRRPRVPNSRPPSVV